MIEPGTIVGGRYRVVRPLGGGGMKLVYLAEDLRLAARPCAFAEMVDSFTSPQMQKQATDAFMREADMLAQLSNEHIPRVFDRFSEENHHYLVMEYIEGVTLEQKLKDEGGKLGERETIEFALQVLDTLGYLHHLEPPVIYRDLKPSNVMLTPSGLAKLIDFGIARFFQPMRNATMIGTQGYAPPEQYRGKVEFRSDLYALGATMHHALSGRDPALEPPFSFPPLRTLCPGVTPALADLIDQALKYDAALRVADVAEFKDRLLAIKNGMPAAAAIRPNGGAAPGRSQMNLPLSNPAAMGSFAPTVLSDAIDSQCPRCGRRIPIDSNYCSFCAADVTGRLRAMSAPGPEARTIVLNKPAGEFSLPPPRLPNGRGANRNRLAIFAIVMGGFFLLGYLALRPFLEPQIEDTPPASGAPPDYGPPAAPGGAEPNHTDPRLAMLRNTLNAFGYSAVHFRVEGHTIVLWGTVASEADRMMVRMMVQAQVATIGGIYSMADRLQVSNSFASP